MATAWELHRRDERIESAHRLAATLARPTPQDMWRMADELEVEIANEGHASVGLTLLAVAMLRAGATQEGEG